MELNTPFPSKRSRLNQVLGEKSMSGQGKLITTAKTDRAWNPPVLNTCKINSDVSGSLRPFAVSRMVFYIVTTRIDKLVGHCTALNCCLGSRV